MSKLNSESYEIKICLMTSRALQIDSEANTAISPDNILVLSLFIAATTASSLI